MACKLLTAPATICVATNSSSQGFEKVIKVFNCYANLEVNIRCDVNHSVYTVMPVLKSINSSLG